MSKKVVTKKKAMPPAENGAPPAAPASSDVRVAQQLRVLETVAAKGDADEKTYSPRTERYIQQLTDVLDFFEYSRSDIAALVRRCHFDENQIQMAVANIVEDRANHEQEEWGTVKNKKQAKEERKLKEEEEKKEQERLEKEQEKQRREAERKAAKEAREAERAKRGKGGGKNGAEAEMPPASLPPDPAILFAGTKQSSEDQEHWKGGGGGGQWWESGGNTSWNSKSWEWESWREDDWSNSKGQEDGWWGGQWEKAGSRRKGYKDKKDSPAEEDDDAEGVLWDMPDTSAQPDEQGGLDQWTLGHLPVHERLMESEQTLGMPKALPENALTLEELERDHLAAPAAPPVVPAPPMPQAAPQVSAPMPNIAPPSTKPLIDALPPQQDLLAALGSQPVAASPSSVPVADDRGDRQDRGDKGRGKGGKKGGKGERDRAEGEKERLERIDRSDDPRRQAVEQVGEVVTVRKHSSMGCAVVSMSDVRVRQAIVEEGNECVINGIKVQIKPHTNKETKEEVLTDLFVAWGRQAEKQNPLSEQTIAKYFDTKHKELTGSWKAAEEEKLRAEEQERRQQEQVLRERTEQRRRYEEQQEQLRRQQEAESQNKYKEQVEEQQRRLREQWTRAQTQQAGLTMGADAYAQGQQPQRQQAQAAQAMQWAAAGNSQWMQAMYANWTQQMQHQQQQQQQQQQRSMQMQGMTGQEGVDMRQYWAQYMDQQRGQNAYAQASQPGVQGGYPGQAAFNYGAAAYARGERI